MPIIKSIFLSSDATRVMMMIHFFPSDRFPLERHLCLLLTQWSFTALLSNFLCQALLGCPVVLNLSIRRSPISSFVFLKTTYPHVDEYPLFAPLYLPAIR